MKMTKCNTYRIPINILPIITCTAIRHSGVDEWNFLWARFLNSNVEWFKQIYLSALSCSENPWLLNRLTLLDNCTMK